MRISRFTLRLVTALLFFTTAFSGAVRAQVPLVYGASPFQDSLWAIDTTSWTVVSRLSPTIPGFTIDGITAMAWDPCQLKTYAVAKLTGAPNRHLVTIDLPTGVCTDVGDLGANFATITFDKSGLLYGVTGDGASPSETLFEINKSTADTNLLTGLGVGADGEVITYNQWDNRFFHWSGNGTVEYEKFLHSPPYSATFISSGPPALEIFGAICLSANQILVSTIESDLRYVDTVGNFGSALISLPDDLRGLVVGIDFAVVDDTICAGDSITINNAGANVYGYDVIYAWGDGTRDTVAAGLSASHTFTSPGLQTVNILLWNGICEDDTFTSKDIMVFNVPAVNLTPTLDTLLCIGDTLLLSGSSGGTSQWYMNGAPLPGETTPFLTVTTTGIYNMTKTNLNGCSDSSAVGAYIEFTLPVADIDSLAPDTTNAGVVENFTNTSTGFVFSSWDYGDATPLDPSTDGSHSWAAPGTYTITLIVTVGSCSDTTTHDIVVLDSIAGRDDVMGERFSLMPPVPNPFVQSTSLSFLLPQAGNARLVIHDLMGGEMTVLSQGFMRAGLHTVDWNGTRLDGSPAASGIYFCTLEYRGEKKTVKVLLQR